MSLSSHRQQQQSRVEVWNAIRPDPNYIPGLGRGAQGFTTRSDIGPSKFTPTPAQQAQAKQDQDEAAKQQEFDHFMGADAGMFAYGDYDEDDKEADEIYAHVDDVMDKRRKVHREKRERQEYDEFRKENPMIKETFSDLKRDLANVSEDEWRGIPEIGDYTIKRRKRFENFSANSDSMLAGALATATGNTGNHEQSGSVTPGTMTDLTALGQGKKQMLGVNLDRMADSVSGQTTVDPSGYLTSLNNKTVTSAAEVQDIKRARTLMKSMVTSNPSNARGWIAYARLEEVTGNLKTARTLIGQGIEACPKNEDVWLEAARLQTQENARSVLARGVQALPTSVKLWMQAARAEPEDAAKRRVLRKALERNAGSVRLWKAAVELHEEEEALLLLSRAVDCCPDQVDLWIALVRLEPSFEKAKKALNRAVKAIPTEPILYITAAKLQESHGDITMVSKIISRAITKKLPENGVIIDRETWLKEAETAEKASPPMTETCRAIVAAVVDVAVDERERKDTYHRDADEAARRGSVHTARTILQHACEVFPDSERSWRASAELEKANGNQEELHAVLQRAVQACPQSVTLWLMNAKEHWLAGDVPAARAALEAAHDSIPESEEIVLAAFKLEFENGEADRARVIAIRAKDSLPDASARVWMKAAVASRELGNEQEEKKLLEEGVEKFGDAPKLHMMLAQFHGSRGDVPAARRALQAGLKASPRSVPLWLMLARLEEKEGNVPSARALLEQARLRVPKSPELWRAAVRTELRCGNSAAAEVTLNRALQDCEGVAEGEGVGSLWAMYIDMAPRAQRKARMADAVRKTDDDAAVFAAFGRVFMADRKYDKARKYFQRATTLMPDIGDFWGMWVACETAESQPPAVTAVIEQAQKADPHHGQRWCQIRKAPINAHKPFGELMKLLLEDLLQRPDKDL